MPEYDVSQGAGNVPCDTNEGLELGGGNVDRFDEMATNAVACAACKLGIRHKAEMCVVQRVAAALRETDAKAREEGRREERERCEGIAKDIEYMHASAHRLDHAYTALAIRKRITGTPAIREGADACGTCGGVGTIRVHDPDDCSLYEDPVTRSHFDEYGKCNRCYPRRVPCPACQGGDDA